MPRQETIEEAFGHVREAEDILLSLIEDMDEAGLDDTDMALLAVQAARLAAELEDLLL